MKEKSKGIKESKKVPQLSLKEKRKLKKERKKRWVRKCPFRSQKLFERIQSSQG